MISIVFFAAEIILDYVESLSVGAQYEYLLYLDGRDSLHVGDASNIVKDFQSYDCEMLVLGTHHDHPPNKRLR